MKTIIQVIRAAIAQAHTQSTLDTARAAHAAAMQELQEIERKRQGARSPRTFISLQRQEDEAWARLHKARGDIGMAHAVSRRLSGQPQQVHQ